MIRTTLGAIALAMIGFAASHSVVAAQAKKMPAPAIAVIDMQQVLRESKVGQDINRQLEPYARGLQDELNKGQETFRREEEELRRQQAVLAPDAFAQRSKQFQDRWNEVNRQIQVRRQAFERSQNAASVEVKKQLRTIVDGLAREMGFNLVLEKVTTVYSSESLEITRQVVQRLDQSLPSLQVPAPSTQ
jgi:outer membrane protein